jgi:hypothetical protein
LWDFKRGNALFVNIRKVIEKRMRRQGKGVNAAGDVHAVIAANVGEGRSHTHVSSHSRQRIVQRSARTQTPLRGGEGGDAKPAEGERKPS